MHTALRTSLFLSTAIVVLACSSGGDNGDTADTSEEEVEEISFEPPPPPSLTTATDRTDAPLFVFVFTHTEDHINHEHSEERYQRLGPMVRDFATDNPDAHLVWTLQFQGADAQTVAERNAETQIVTDLTALASDGLIHFGYHGHHEPTYQNRATTSLTAESTWEEVVAAVDELVSCEKEPYLGDCIVPTGGGIMAVERSFGDVEVVSGVAVGDGLVGWESRGGHHAIAQRTPHRMIGFGFTDHGPDTYPTYDEVVDQIMTILSPSIETSGSMFWMDDAIRINDGDPTQDAHSVPLHNNPRRVRQVIESVERSRPHVINALLGSKYLYTQSGISPTGYAYSHPDAPQLTEDHLLDRAAIDQNYANTETNLAYLAGFFESNPGSRFVGPNEIISLVAPDAYWGVNVTELDAVASWLYHHWDDGPPAFLSDGQEFYSLRDALGLFATALSEDLPNLVDITLFFGPLEAVEGTEVTLSAADIDDLAGQITGFMEADSTWETTPSNIVPSSFETANGTVSTAQALYAMALLYASRRAGTPLETVDVPATTATPETYDLLLEIGCLACVDTAWSLKPARIHHPL